MPARTEIGELERPAAEQAALRRVATPVARGVSLDGLCSAITSEVGWLFGAESAIAGSSPMDQRWSLSG